MVRCGRQRGMVGFAELSMLISRNQEARQAASATGPQPRLFGFVHEQKLQLSHFLARGRKIAAACMKLARQTAETDEARLV